MENKAKLTANYQRIIAEIKSAKLLVVSKTRSLEEIEHLYSLGARDFGENRVQDLAERAEALKASCPEIRWHMIGHLQSNKLKNLLQVPNLVAIHSVDTKSLAQKLAQIELVQASAKPLQIFIQVNTSHEEEKSGVKNQRELWEAYSLLKTSRALKVAGLMTMGTLRTENRAQEARRCFGELVRYRDWLKVEDKAFAGELSMGMSQDYAIAVECGASWVRIGTILFT